VPYALPDVVTSRTCASFRRALPSELDPGVLFKVPYAFREETGSDQVEEACRDDEEDLQTCAIAALVDEPSDEGARTETAEYGEREGRRWQT
jgi:hypothetical protein